MRSIKLCLCLLLPAALAAVPAFAQIGMDISAADFGVRITTTGSDAIRIVNSSDDGIQIGADPDYPNYGLYIPSPGVSGYGLWPNTANAQGEWALFTVDNILAGNVSSFSQSLIVHVGPGDSVVAGDIVAAVGVGPMEEGVSSPAVAVQRATMTSGGVIGVVQSRMQWLEPPGKQGERAMESAEGPAQPGDYVSVTITGVALAKIDSGTVIVPGQRLALGNFDGRARPLRTRNIDGFLVAEAVPTIGVALEASSGDKDTVLVFVSTR